MVKITDLLVKKGAPRNYAYVHFWLSKHYGRATHCENPKCEKQSSQFEWALIHDKIEGAKQ